MVGDRNYIVTDGGRDFVLHVDKLRHFVSPPTEGWNIPEEVLAKDCGKLGGGKERVRWFRSYAV